MRIIAGLYGGRILKSPHGYVTHPMSDRMKSSLFASLGDLTGKTVWDAFSGSGALALESVSRGAKEAVATERDRNAFKTLQENIAILGAENIKAVRSSCSGWSSTNPEAKFDIIFCDPPYNDLQLSTVFAQKKHMNDKGLMVLSYPGRDPVPLANGVVVVDNRNYGDAALAYYRLK